MTRHLESTREQRNTLERLSLTHGNAACFLYEIRGTPGALMLAEFADGHAITIDHDGRTKR